MATEERTVFTMSEITLFPLYHYDLQEGNCLCAWFEAWCQLFIFVGIYYHYSSDQITTNTRIVAYLAHMLTFMIPGIINNRTDMSTIVR